MNEALILVPLDGTVAARAALPIAQALGDAMRASLRILHVDHGPPVPLAELATRLGAEGAALHGWSIAARGGDPAAVILDEARHMSAVCIVLCTHTAQAGTVAPLGRTAFAVLRDAPCPVVLVPPSHADTQWRPGRIVLPYDGSPASNAAVAPAAALTCVPGAELLVLQVGSTDVAARDSGSLGLPRYVDQPQHEWASWTEELLDRLSSVCDDAPLRAHLHVRGGDPATQIVRFADEHGADLIVVAWKGAWSDTRALTLQAIVRDATCPVMVVRG